MQDDNIKMKCIVCVSVTWVTISLTKIRFRCRWTNKKRWRHVFIFLLDELYQELIRWQVDQWIRYLQGRERQFLYFCSSQSLMSLSHDSHSHVSVYVDHSLIDISIGKVEFLYWIYDDFLYSFFSICWPNFNFINM